MGDCGSGSAKPLSGYRCPCPAKPYAFLSEYTGREYRGTRMMVPALTDDRNTYHAGNARLARGLSASQLEALRERALALHRLGVVSFVDDW